MPLSGQVCMQWATVVVIEQMQRWRCPTYTPRTTVIAPYSSTEVVHALPEAEKHTLLFFRCGSHPAMTMCLMGFHSTDCEAHAAVLRARPASCFACLPDLACMAHTEENTLLFFRRGLHPAAPLVHDRLPRHARIHVLPALCMPG